jgi:hypothetical protein
MGTGTTIIANVEYGLAMQFKKKAEELDLKQSTLEKAEYDYENTQNRRED